MTWKSTKHMAQLQSPQQHLPITHLARNRILLLTSALLAEILIMSALLPKDPLIGSRIQRLLQAQYPSPQYHTATEYQAQLRRDPAIGWIMPRDGVGAALRRMVHPPLSKHSRGGTLLINVGDRQCCMHTDLKSWERAAAQRQLVVVLYSAATQGAVSRQLYFLRHDLGLTSPVLFDSDQHLTAALNTVWTPRAYLFSPNWRLKWLQRTIGVAYYDPFAAQDFR